MSGILRLENLNKGTTLKQGDKTVLSYRLSDADGEKLNIAGNTAVARLMHPDFTRIGYESEALTVSEDNIVQFSIDSIIPSRLYYLEITVDGQYIFPSRSDEGKLSIDRSSMGAEITIIENAGIDAVVRKAVDLINEDPSLIIDEDKLFSEIIANTPVGNIEEYYQQFSDVIKELSKDNDYNSLPEIAVARRGYDTLAESLQNLSVNMLNPNLGKLTQIHISDELIAQIAGDTSVNAIPADGSLTTEKFSEGAVIPEVTNFFEISKNLFDFTDERIVDGYIINDTDGTLTIMEGGNPLYYVSHPIRAIKDRPIFIPYVMRLALYDNSGNYIEGVRQSLGSLVYTPSENGYIKFTSYKEGKIITDMQVEYGESGTEYTPFVKKIKEEFLSEGKDIIVTPDQTTFFEKSKNIFNENEVERGFYLNNITGDKAYIESYETSGYIPMIKDVPVSINLVYTINFYDVQKNRINGERLASNQQHTFTPTYDGFFRFSYRPDVIPARLIQVEYNDTSTDFEPAYTRIKPEFIGSESKLTGKSLANFGDSIASAQTEGVDGYHEIISKKYGMTLHNFARNGAKITNVDGETNHIKTQLDSAISTGVKPDYVLFDGLRNDVMNDISTFGEITTGYDQTLNLATFCGAFEYYCKTMRETWLDSKIIYVRTHNTSTVSYDRQKQLGELAVEICEKYSIPVVDIWKEGGINTQFSGFVGPYTLTDTDATHPNTLGYEKFYVPLIESKMLSI